MKILSPGILSEFIFHHFNGEIIEHDDCIQVRTPDNPSYYFGNFLYFPDPPSAGDDEKWVTRFETLFGNDPCVRHHTFTWPPTGVAVLDGFKDSGFTVDDTSVLAAKSTHTQKPIPTGIEFRKLETDAEWRAATELQIKLGNPSLPADDYRDYKIATFKGYRAMSDAGKGGWFGAFDGETLVADLGLFFEGNIGRFQSVETAPEYRRRGICSALVHFVSQWGFRSVAGANLIIHADMHEIARSIYQSLGYEEIEVLQSTYRPPQSAGTGT